MPSNHLILCHPLLLPSIFPSIRVFSNESALQIRWPKYWSFSFSISPSSEYAGLISFRVDSELNMVKLCCQVSLHCFLLLPLLGKPGPLSWKEFQKKRRKRGRREKEEGEGEERSDLFGPPLYGYGLSSDTIN